MKLFNFPLCLIVSLLLVCSPVGFAEETIDWDGLVPPLDRSSDPYANMPQDMSWAIMRLLNIRHIKASGDGNERIDNIERGYLEKLAAGGYDLDEVLRQKAEFDRLKQANEHKLVTDLDNKQVRIAGYLLPTEFSGSKAVEFLLVPSEGACIHTPAPPANQVVHVSWEKGFEHQGLYAPVWVSGRISTVGVMEAVTFRDGTADVAAGYSMSATRVELYRN